MDKAEVIRELGAQLADEGLTVVSVADLKSALRDEVEAAYGNFQEDGQVINEALADDEADGAEYATYPDTADAPANLNEDDELPPYSVYARYYQTDKPLKYPVLACGHKFRGQFEPSHRNCERCWFTYFQVNGELTQSVEEAFAVGGPKLIDQLKTKTFTHNFRKFMSTVAFLKQQQELAAAKEKNESTTGLGGTVTEQQVEGEPGYGAFDDEGTDTEG
jgi:hypothetical protein